MNNLYKLLSKNINIDTTEIEVKLTDKNHPIFQAHFPENSLLPGFLQIDIFAEIFNLKVSSIKKAKFLSPILPEDTVIFHIKKDNKKISVITKKNNKKCSEFTIVTE